jgi:hypothetical protein
VTETIEYTGLLVGGPKSWESVTTIKPRFKVQEITSLWLDGEEEKPTIQTTEGTYIWNEKESIFEWELKGVGYSTR